MPVIDPATSGAFTAQPATGHTLCEQIARLWAARSTLVHPDGTGLLFAEHGSETPANLYAGELPRLAHRLRVGAVLACDGDARAAGGDTPGVQINVAVECHAPTQRNAVALGADLVRCLLPGRGAWNEPVTRGGVDLFGAVGFPTVAAGAQVGLWRVLGVQVGSGPRAVPSRTVDGQALAVVQLIVDAASLEWQEP